MTYTKILSSQKKAKAIVFLIKKYGHICWYCETPFVEQLTNLHRTIDHLNNNELDNRLENLVLAHFECNQKKKENPDWQIRANDQLKMNVKDPDFLKIEGDGVSEREKNTNTHDDEMTDGDINRIINRTVEQFLVERLPEDKPDKVLTFIDTMNSITFLVQKETNKRGSQPAVRRALEVRCCSISEFEIFKESGKRYVRRKTR